MKTSVALASREYPQTIEPSGVWIAGAATTHTSTGRKRVEKVAECSDVGPAACSFQTKAGFSSTA